MCAASPARNSRPKRIGSATKLRSGAMLFSSDAPVTSACVGVVRQAPPQLVPESVVAPVLGVGRRAGTGGSSATARVRAHRAQRKAALVVDVDEFVGDRRRVRQQAQPAERVDLLVDRQRPLGHAGAADAVIAVAAGDEVAGKLARHAVLAPGQRGCGAVEVVQRDVRGLVDGAQSCRRARFHQVARDLGLAVDHHPLAAGQPGEVDAVAVAVKGNVEAVVQQPLGVHARADAGLVEQVRRRLLEHAGADARKHVLAALRARRSRCRCPPCAATGRAAARPGRRR